MLKHPFIAQYPAPHTHDGALKPAAIRRHYAILALSELEGGENLRVSNLELAVRLREIAAWLQAGEIKVVE